MGQHSIYQRRLMLKWNSTSVIQYLTRLKAIAFAHHVYFNKFSTVADLERAVWNFVEKRRVFDFDKHVYVESKGDLS